MEPGLIFKNISSLANLNVKQVFLHTKLLGKGIQEKLL